MGEVTPALGLGGAQTVLELFEAADLIALTIDAAGRITYCNRYLAELTGFDQDELLGREYFATFEPHQPPGAMAEHLAGVAAGRRTRYSESIVRTRAGEERLISWSDTLVRSEDGEIAGILSIGQDITDHHVAQTQLSAMVSEQAALRRVATLVAAHRPADELLAAVSEEAGRLLGADSANTIRFGAGDRGIVVGVWHPGEQPYIPVGTELQLDGATAVGQVLRTGREARVDDYAQLDGEHARMLRETIGIRSGVAAPIRAVGRLWGAIAVSEFGDRALPEDAELRLAQFAELLAQAIANAETRRQLIESRARLVSSADEARRRLERDLHDGAQQRLVSLAIGLRLARAGAPDETTRDALAACSEELGRALDELRELARGLHPVMLSERGLQPAMQAVADRSSVPVRVEVEVGERLAPAQEAALYFTASEALANVARYAGASEASIEVRRARGAVTLTVRDDGAGGADMAKGTGLRGLADRVEALGGALEVVSPPGAGTTLRATLPL